jgi:hypothetical protein
MPNINLSNNPLHPEVPQPRPSPPCPCLDMSSTQVHWYLTSVAAANRTSAAVSESSPQARVLRMIPGQFWCRPREILCGFEILHVFCRSWRRQNPLHSHINNLCTRTPIFASHETA